MRRKGGGGKRTGEEDKVRKWKKREGKEREEKHYPHCLNGMAVKTQEVDALCASSNVRQEYNPLDTERIDTTIYVHSPPS